MKVWYASFQLSQERLIFLLLGCPMIAFLGSRLEVLAPVATLNAQFSFIPAFWGVANPGIRAAILMLALWLALSIAFTIKIRLDIRRDNYVRPKQ